MVSLHFTTFHPLAQRMVLDLELGIPLVASLESGLEQLYELMRALCQVFKGT